MNGEPLHYVTSKTQYAVFSVGADGMPCAAPFLLTPDALRRERTMLVIPSAKPIR